MRLLNQIVEELKGIGEIKYEHLFVDGTKIKANANKYSFVWKKSTNKIEQRVLEKLKEVTTDAGYESEENYTYFENIKTECYIKPQNYERGKTKKFKSNMALRENMAYDPELDEYTCQPGKKTEPNIPECKRQKSGYEREATYYECDDCFGCPYKKKCTRAKGNRKLQVSKKFIAQRAASLERITSPKGIQLRMNRSIQSEGAFGVVKQNYGFQRFLLRGNKKVSTEILLVAMAYNVNKLHSKIQQNRTGTQLFEKNSA